MWLGGNLQADSEHSHSLTLHTSLCERTFEQNICNQVPHLTVGACCQGKCTG